MLNLLQYVALAEVCEDNPASHSYMTRKGRPCQAPNTVSRTPRGPWVRLKIIVFGKEIQSKDNKVKNKIVLKYAKLQWQ